jgi:glycosyltransferase involved in cell wall biosynthesis
MNAAFPGVSVLLPVYFPHLSVEAVRLLLRAIESILDQGYAGPLEILIIDDGSPVPGASIADDLGLAASKVRWIRLKQNAGIVSALNVGIAAAQYPLIGRIDADDRWLPGKLKAQVAQFMADPDLSISATGMVRVEPDGAVIDTHVRPGDWTGILRFFVEGGCPFPHGSVLAKQAVYRVLGGYPYGADVRHCEDYALWGTWLRFFKPAMVEVALYEYRVSRNSISSQHDAQQHQASQAVRQRFAELDLAEVLPRALPDLAAGLNSTLFTAGQLAFHVWQYGGALSLPKPALAPLAAVLPDRILEPAAESTPWWSALGKREGSLENLCGVAAKPFR